LRRHASLAALSLAAPPSARVRAGEVFGGA